MSDKSLEEHKPWYAVAGGMIAGLCASTVVTNLIKTNIDFPATFKNKLVIFIGTSAISGAVASLAGRYVEMDISQISKLVSEIKDVFTISKEAENAGRDTERNPEEPAA